MNTPVNFELAKLLKEKGYNEPHDKIYSILGELWKSYYQSMKNDNPENGSCCTAPTIAEVVMWLYEKHGVWISVEQNSFIGGGKSSFISNVERTEYNSPTEAYEAAIEYTLNNLI